MQNNNDNQDFLEFFAQSVAKHLKQYINQPVQKEVSKSPEEEYFTTNQAKEYLQVSSTTTLKSYVDRGFIPKPRKVGGRKLVYKKSDLKNFLENGI